MVFGIISTHPKIVKYFWNTGFVRTLTDIEVDVILKSNCNESVFNFFCLCLSNLHL